MQEQFFHPNQIQLQLEKEKEKGKRKKEKGKRKKEKGKLESVTFFEKEEEVRGRKKYQRWW